MARNWLGTKALYNLEVDGLRKKASSLVELIFGFGGIKSSFLLARDWLVIGS